MAIYKCRQCHSEEFAPRRYRYHLGPSCRCPVCGTYRVVRLKTPDKIDKKHGGFLNLLERLAGKGRLFHCRWCRLQFYDRRETAPPTAAGPHTAGAAPGAETDPHAADAPTDAAASPPAAGVEPEAPEAPPVAGAAAEAEADPHAADAATDAAASPPAPGVVPAAPEAPPVAGAAAEAEPAGDSAP